MLQLHIIGGVLSDRQRSISNRDGPFPGRQARSSQDVFSLFLFSFFLRASRGKCCRPILSPSCIRHYWFHCVPASCKLNIWASRHSNTVKELSPFSITLILELCHACMLHASLMVKTIADSQRTGNHRCADVMPYTA